VLHDRDIGAGVQYQVSRHVIYIHRYGWRAVLQYDGGLMVPDRIFGRVEAKGAVIIYASLAFP
jgi:hypothetical protein